jgi:hypothetical protein
MACGGEVGAPSGWDAPGGSQITRNLEISVGDSVLVHVGSGREDLLHDLGGVVLREVAPVDDRAVEVTPREAAPQVREGR